MTDGSTVTIEGFVTDNAFVDQTKAINGILVDGSGKVASLTPHALSYFSIPSSFNDTRLPTARAVNWNATSSPRLIVDRAVFGNFVTVINALTNTAPIGFFKILDKLLFDYNGSVSHASLETYLTTDADTSAIYVPNSFSLSATIVSDEVYLSGGATAAVSVPTYVDFQITLPTGSTTVTFALRLFTSVDAWIAGYNSSTIVTIVPPLPYDKLFNAPLTTSTDNIFATANTSAVLSYTQTQALLGSVSVSGVIEYRVGLTDGTNNVSVPFNLLYKGRPPTTFEIRNAIRAALLASGIGTSDGWRARVPGVFVSGRFYIVPLWDSTFSKPDQVIFPNITNYSAYATITNRILASLGYGDVTTNIELLSINYQRMMASVVPDLSGSASVAVLSSLIPDYQDYATTDEQFSYMNSQTQQFSRDFNAVLAIEAGAQSTLAYTSQQEGVLSFYTFTVGNYEICVISKLCFESIMESTQ